MKINEVTKTRLPVLEATADEVRAGLQQRLTTKDYDRTMSWIANDYNDFATQADVDRFISDAAAERDNFWQMGYARKAREAIFGLETGAGRRDNTPTGEDPIVPLDTVTPTGELPPGHVIPRPSGGFDRRNWEARYNDTHNPDGTPKDREDTDATDPRGDQTAPPPRTDATPPVTPTTPSETPPETPRTDATPPERPGERPAPTSSSTPAVDDPEAGDGPEPSQSAEPAFTLSGNLRQGSRGDEVRRLQAALGMPQSEQDGIFGPRTAQAVRTFQQSQGLQVDGVVGRQTLAAIQRTRGNASAPRNVQPGQIQNQSKENKGNALIEGILKNAGLEKKRLDEASISINGADASEVAEILRMMQLAGASGAKVVGADDINPGPKPCPICGKVHGPMPSPGGCGSKPSEPGMGDMIRMISSEEEELDEWENNAPGHEGDAEYMNATDAAYPEGNDMHKKKKSYPATAGGDNPMNTESLESELKSRLTQALAEKKKPKPDYIDIDGDGDTEEPMKKAAKEKKSKGIQAMIDAGNKKADAEANEGYKLGKFKKRHKQKKRFM